MLAAVPAGDADPHRAGADLGLLGELQLPLHGVGHAGDDVGAEVGQVGSAERDGDGAAVLALALAVGDGAEVPAHQRGLLVVAAGRTGHVLLLPGWESGFTEYTKGLDF
ncbi:hypothetical protein BH09PAT4_BH09PAT4_07570 [soil metagenome]